MKRKLVISISGGRTSAVMTKRVIEKLSDKFDITLVFANTGLEHGSTYFFRFFIFINWDYKLTFFSFIIHDYPYSH